MKVQVAVNLKKLEIVEHDELTLRAEDGEMGYKCLQQNGMKTAATVDSGSITWN